MKRFLYDMLVLASCILAPWMLSITLIIIGLLIFESWHEGVIFSIVLDIALFSGIFGFHTIYTIMGFYALYYVTIRFTQMLRV